MSANPLLAIVLLVVATPLGSTPASDAVIQIRDLEAQQESAWNAHDASAYSKLFTSDADTVNVLGWWWRSRDELESKLSTAFRFVFAGSRLHLDEVSVRFLTDQVAIVHVQWSMTGALSPNGSGNNVPSKGIQTQTLLRTQEGWRIAAFHNVNQTPERAFPTTPH
jgi:uncharacterized protein (TIGR02246 family)